MLVYDSEDFSIKESFLKLAFINSNTIGRSLEWIFTPCGTAMLLQCLLWDSIHASLQSKQRPSPVRSHGEGQQ